MKEWSNCAGLERISTEIVQTLALKSGGADEKRNSSKPLYFRPFFSSAGAIGAVIQNTLLCYANKSLVIAQN